MTPYERGLVRVALVVLGLALLLTYALLARAGGSTCSPPTCHESANQRICVYSCVNDDGSHSMVEVSCPLSGGPCRTRVY